MGKTEILGLDGIPWVDESGALRRALGILRAKGNLRLVGETGTGKTTLVHHIRDSQKARLYETSLTQDTNRWDLLAAPTLRDGSTVVEPRVVLQWLRDTKDAKVPKLLHLDELNLAMPGVVGLVHSLADFRRNINVPELGETVARSPAHWMVVSLNPAERSSYSGAIQSNIATTRRFLSVRLDFLSIGAEADLVLATAERGGLGFDFRQARRLADWAHKTRVEYENGNLGAPVTTGNLLDILDLVREGFTVDEGVAIVADMFLPDETTKVLKFWRS